MRNLSIRNITRATGGEFFGSDELLDRTVAGVDKDSREIKEDYLYIPTFSLLLLLQVNLIYY